jgi:hypothetical protein
MRLLRALLDFVRRIFALGRHPERPYTVRSLRIEERADSIIVDLGQLRERRRRDEERGASLRAPAIARRPGLRARRRGIFKGGGPAHNRGWMDSV